MIITIYFKIMYKKSKNSIKKTGGYVEKKYKKIKIYVKK